MDGLGSLGDAEKVVGGGLGLVLLLAGRSFWTAYKEWRKEQREERASRDDHDAKQQGRLAQSFAVADASKDKEIERLNAARDADAKRHDTERQRWADDLRREREARQAAEEDRDVGWDKGRAMEDQAHHYRHICTNLLLGIYSAGRMGLPMPEGVQRFYDAGRNSEALPTDLVPRPVPSLQDMPRKPPQ